MHSKKALAVALSRLAVFTSPNSRLEQYPTESEVAASMLWDATLQGNISGKQVVDLGCGTGILGIGALLLGAKHVTFIDKDEKALQILRKNLAALSIITRRTILESDVRSATLAADTVIMNPPFGTRQEHIDTVFLSVAKEIAPHIYSIHKTSTLPYLHRFCAQQGLAILSMKRHDLALQRSMSHHTRKLRRIDITVLRLARHPREVRTKP